MSNEEKLILLIFLGSEMNIHQCIAVQNDSFYEKFSEILSSNGKRPHARSRLPENKQWNENVELYYEKNPRRRPRK